MRIAFLHPDLGIGGAERLVVDAALALQAAGHQVDIFTSHHDPSHCFEETRDGTLSVFVYGDHLPRNICGGGAILCAILRNLWASATILSEWTELPPSSATAAAADSTVRTRTRPRPLGSYDVMIVDQLSVSLPLLCAAPATTRLFFYCHFPDLLLTQRQSLLKRLYRLPFDALEEATTAVADAVVVNSRFTASQYLATFKRIAAKGPAAAPGVLYPSINFSRYDDNQVYDGAVSSLLLSEPSALHAIPAPLPLPLDGSPLELALESRLPLSAFVFLSINRYERKKEVDVAVRAFAQAWKAGDLPSKASPSLPLSLGGTKSSQSSARVFTSARLVIAGGHDPRVAENAAVHSSLRDLAVSLGLTCADLPSLADVAAAAAAALAAAGVDAPSEEQKAAALAAAEAKAVEEWDASAQVIFIRSFSEPQRRSLLRRAQVIAYTPTGEHFGIVPVEAMYARRPVVACASGGPLESVAVEEPGQEASAATDAGCATGILCTPGDSNSFASAFARLAHSPALAAAMGERGPAHVKRLFSFESFQRDLCQRVEALAREATVSAPAPTASVSSAPALRARWQLLGSSPRTRVAVAGAMLLCAVATAAFLLVAGAALAAHAAWGSA